MSDPRRYIAALTALGAFMLGTSALGAQSPAVSRDSMLENIRALDSVVIERSRSVDSVRRALVRPVPPITVRRGTLEVRTVAALEPRVRAAVDSVAGLIDRRGGPALSARVAGHVPMILPDSTREVFGVVRVLIIVPDTNRRSAAVTRRSIPATAPVSQIANGIAATVEQFALQGVDSALAAWVMVGRLPLRAPSDAEATDAYIDLATIESEALRRCRAGDAASCLDVLGIDSLPGTRLARWYTPDDYRALLRIVAPPREDSVAVAAWVRCREQHDRAACATAANSLPDSRVPLPMSSTARLLLLHEVLDAGGPAAYGRLVTATGPMRARLEYASGEPLDSTVRRWRDHVEGARPDAMRLRPGLVVASLGWTSALLGLTLIRRTQWA